MKRRIILILTMLAMCLAISSCTHQAKATLITRYIPSEKKCVIKNVSDHIYQDLKVSLTLEQLSNELKKEIDVNVGELKNGESYTYTLTNDDIKNMNTDDIAMYINSCTYYEDTLLVYLAKFVLGSIVGVILIFLLFVLAESI